MHSPLGGNGRPTLGAALLVTIGLLAAACSSAAPPAANQPTTSAGAPAAPKPTTAAAGQAATTTAAQPAGGTGQPTAQAPTTSAAAGGQPQSGGTATIPIAADPTLNPWHPNAFVESIFVNRVLFDGLTKPGKDLNPAPDLAASWEAATDGLSWTFKVRKDATWSDGQPLTADDVLFTFNDIVLKKELGATGAGNFTAVRSRRPEPRSASQPSASLREWSCSFW